MDSEAARYALIKGQSLSRAMNVLVREFYDADSSHSSYGWIERVPSYSNVADDPSRGRPEVACNLLGISSWEPFEHVSDLVDRISKCQLVITKGGKILTSWYANLVTSMSKQSNENLMYHFQTKDISTHDRFCKLKKMCP